MFVIEYEDTCEFWNVCLPADLMEPYTKRIAQIDEFIYELIHKIKADRAEVTAVFIQLATELMNFIVLTCGDLEKNGIPEYFLNENGTFNSNKMREFCEIKRYFDPEMNKPYSDNKSRIFSFVPELFKIADDETLAVEEGLAYSQIDRKAFEAYLSTDELKFSWFEYRHLAVHFFHFIENTVDMLIALDTENRPVFLFFIEPQRQVQNDLESGKEDNDHTEEGYSSAA